MRLTFVFCLVVCSVAVTAPAITDPELITTVSDRLDAGPGEAQPVDLVVMAPTPSPTARATPAPTRAPVRTPPPVKLAAAKPSPLPHITPTPKPTPTPTPTPRPTPTPTPTPTPESSGRTYSRDEAKTGIRAGWGGDDEQAIRVADCESGLNSRATSPDGRYLGLWQMRQETWQNYGGSGDPRDHSPQEQTVVAWRLYQQRGWSPWAGCN
jgi:hypothetical protein